MYHKHDFRAGLYICVDYVSFNLNICQSKKYKKLFNHAIDHKKQAPTKYHQHSNKQS